MASPLLVTSFDGRPIKIEGNPDASLFRDGVGRAGAADAHAQASILEMYDPDRSRAVINRAGGDAVAGDWDRFAGAMSSTIDALTSRRQGEGLAILSESTSSRTTAAAESGGRGANFRRRSFTNTSR